MMNNKRMIGIRAPALFVAALAAASALADAAMAQSFPSRPITFIYPYVAGGAADTMLRVMSGEAQKILGQPVVIESRPGAGGRLGLQALAANRGQGHVLSMVASTLVVNEVLRDPELNILPGRDYMPIVLPFEGAYVLAANASRPIRDVASLVAYAKNNRGKANWGSGGPAANGALTMAIMNDQMGTDFTGINYNKGEPPIFQALLTGEVDVALASLAVKPLIDTGKVVPLAVTTAKRAAAFPNVPTGAEAGIPFITGMGFWVGLIGPLDVPRDVTLKLNRVFNDSAKVPEVAKKMSDFNYEPVGGTPEDMAAIIQRDLDKLRPIFKKLNIK